MIVYRDTSLDTAGECSDRGHQRSRSPPQSVVISEVTDAYWHVSVHYGSSREREEVEDEGVFYSSAVRISRAS